MKNGKKFPGFPVDNAATLPEHFFSEDVNVENAQMATLPSLIYAHFVSVNEKRCNKQFR